MTMHLWVDGNFVENADWHAAQARYADFTEKALVGKSVYLELGVGFNTPTIIRYPFEQMVYHNPNALLVRLNRDYPEGFAETKDKTVEAALALHHPDDDVAVPLLQKGKNAPFPQPQTFEVLGHPGAAPRFQDL